MYEEGQGADLEPSVHSGLKIELTGRMYTWRGCGPRLDAQSKKPFTWLLNWKDSQASCFTSLSFPGNYNSHSCFKRMQISKMPWPQAVLCVSPYVQLLGL